MERDTAILWGLYNDWSDIRTSASFSLDRNVVLRVRKRFDSVPHGRSDRVKPPSPIRPPLSEIQNEPGEASRSHRSYRDGSTVEIRVNGCAKRELDDRSDDGHDGAPGPQAWMERSQLKCFMGRLE